MDNELNDALAAFKRGDLGRARTLAEQQLQGAPGSAPLQHLLGLIDCRSGKIDSGVEWLRRASDGDPGNIGFRVMLVRALVDAGRAGEALAVAAPPESATGMGLALWQARGEAAFAAQDHEASIDAWRVMVEARPEDWRAWSNLGNVYASLARWDEAADALRRAARLNPVERGIRRNLASALWETGAHGECAEIAAALVADEPVDVKLRLLHAQALSELGRHQESLAEVDKAVELAVGGANSPEAGRELVVVAGEDRNILGVFASLLERTGRWDALRGLLDEAEEQGLSSNLFAKPAAALALRDKDVPRARQLLLLEDPQEDPLRWHRLMGRIADALGDPATAFAEYEAMNRATDDYDSWRARGVQFRRMVRASAAAFTPDLAQRLKPLPSASRRSPAFLVGFPRSGTTLLDTFLMGHPDVEVLEEIELSGAAREVRADPSKIPERTSAELEAARESYFSILDSHVDPAFPGLIVDKLPLNMIALPYIYCLFPDARVIFAQRHPADAVLSGFMQSFVMNDAMACFLDIADGADLYDGALETFTRARNALPLPVHTVVYEELIQDSGAALRPVIDFLGLDWSDGLLDHQATARTRGAIITASYDQVVQPLSREPAGRWRRYEEQLKPVLPLLLPWAERLGY